MKSKILPLVLAIMALLLFALPVLASQVNEVSGMGIIMEVIDEYGI